MSKVVNFVIGAALIVAGIVTHNPGLIISGGSMIVGAAANLLLAPSAKGKARTAAETALNLGEQPRSAIFGEAAVPGSLVDGFNYGGKYETDWEVLIVRLADHKCQSLTGFYVNDEYVAFAGDGPVAGYEGQLAVYFRNDTTNDALPAVVTTNGPGWTAADIGEGGCDVIVAYKADDPEAKNPVWPGGRPRFLWVVKGKYCYIARSDSTVPGGSGAHRWADPATWEWTDNPVDCRYNFVRGIYANDQVGDPDMLLVGRGLSAEEAPPENTFAPANLCDELVGGEKRYRVDGPVYANQEHLEVEEMFAAACGGTVVTREGSVEIEPGQAKSPVAYITDDDLLVASGVEWNHGIPSDADKEWVNTVVARYVEPAQKWNDHAAPVRRDVADIIADKKPREETIGLRLVKRATQAGTVAEIVRRLGRLWGRGAITLGPRFCELEEGDWIVWTSARRFGGDSKTFRIEAYKLDEKWHNRLTLREISGAVFDDGEFDEDLAEAEAAEAPPAIGAPDSGNWALAAEMLDDGGPAIPVLAITGSASDDPRARQIRFEYWRDDGATDPEDVTGWVARGTFGAGTTRVEVSDIASGADYYAAVSYVVDGIPGDRLILGPVTAGSITGTEGPAGLSVSPLRIYKRALTTPALPTATATFTFATGGLAGLDNGWTVGVPGTNGNPLWVSTAFASGNGATDTIGAGEWAGPTIDAQDGATGPSGGTGATGATGAAGLSVAPVRIYKRAAAGSPPAVPSATATVTFATGGITGLNNGWSATVPATDGNPLWVSAAAAVGSGATDTIATGEWATPTIEAQDGAAGATGATGAAGLSVSPVRIYQRAAASPTLPSATATFTFATGAITGLNNGWSASVPTANGNPLWVSAAAAVGSGATDTIGSGEWAAPAIEAQDGATGATGGTGPAGLNSAIARIYKRAAAGSPPATPSATATLTFATGGITGLDNGWSATVPTTDGNPLWVSTAGASGTGATDTIASGEWATPAVEAQDGATGSTGSTGATGGTGAAGVSSSLITLFQRTATNSAPSVPAGTLTYTFATGGLSGTLGNWTTTRQPGGTSGFEWAITATALGTGATDTIGTGEWATPQLIAHGTIERQVLTIEQKIPLGPRIAAIDARYTEVTARAAALGISTTAASNARTALRTYLAALPTAFDKLDADTILTVPYFDEFPSNWTLSGASTGSSGNYTTLTDDSAGAYEYAHRQFAVNATTAVSFVVVIKKDSTPGSTRRPLIRLTNAAETPYAGFLLDTQTGAYTNGGDTAPSDYGVIDLNDTEWMVWMTIPSAAYTDVKALIYPAVGNTSDPHYNPARTGSIDLRFPLAAAGVTDKLGRTMFDYRLKDYEAKLDALDKAISEAAPNVEVPGSIQIDANAGGTTITTLPLTARCKCWIGATDKSPDASWSLGALPAGISATINNTASHADRGVISVTVADAPGNITVNCTPPGYGEISTQIPVTRSQAAAPSGGGAGATFVSDGIFPNVSSGTLADISDVMTIRSTAGGTLIFAAQIRHLPSSGNNANVMGIKARYRTTAGPGAWNDLAAEVTGSANSVDADTGVRFKGAVVIADTTKSGLTASTDYDVVLQGRRFSGSDTLVISASSFTVRQS